MEWLIYLPVLFFSVVVHEFSHGWAAYANGDSTAAKRGRLTLDPSSHVDPFGTVFVPLLCFLTASPMFGWARPVPVDPRRMRSPWRDMMKVAVAGPLANLIVAFGAALLYKAASVTPVFTPEFQKTLLDVLLFAVTLNLFLGFFNLLPIHPLDGSKIVLGLLPKKHRRLYARHMPYGVVIILVLLLTRKFSAVVTWPMKLVLSFWMKIGLIG